MSVPATSADEEFEKRKARAARFGIALVEPPKPKTKSIPGNAPKVVRKINALQRNVVVTRCNYRTLKS